MKTIKELKIKDWFGYFFKEMVSILDIEPKYFMLMILKVVNMVQQYLMCIIVKKIVYPEKVVFLFI